MELGIENAEATAEKWRAIGAEQLNPYACPRTTYKITAVHIKGKSSYRKWLKKTGEKERSPAPEPAKQQTRKMPGRQKKANVVLGHVDLSDDDDGDCAAEAALA